MRPLLLIVVMVLSGCQSLVGSDKLAIFETDTLNSSYSSEDKDLWKVIANQQEIRVDDNSSASCN